MKILNVALQKDGKLVGSSFELIEAAKQLGGEIYTVVLAEDASNIANDLASRGGGKVLAVSDSSLKYFNDEIYVKVISSLVEKYSFDLILGSATFYGKALFSRLAAMLDAPMVSDATNIALESDNPVVTRPSYGGSVIAEVVAKENSSPLCVTLRMKIYPESTEGNGEVIVESVDSSLFEAGTVVKEMKVESAGALNLTEADVIVAAGRGLKGAENLTMIQDLADSLGGAMGASRAIVDAGWIAYSHQVGQTGKTVNPKLYIAVGISGAIQHLVGMQTSGYIVAVNKDKDAPIFNVSTYGIVGDALEIVPALTNRSLSNDRFSTHLINLVLLHKPYLSFQQSCTDLKLLISLHMCQRLYRHDLLFWHFRWFRHRNSTSNLKLIRYLIVL
jgi:electron transfer flavoprotein alpha subunit